MPVEPNGTGDGAVMRVRGLHKRFGAHTVLDGIDLDVARGERIAIIGASGSGKSTFLRCLNFLEIPDEGEVEFAGETIRAGRRRTQRELAALRQRAGMVFQHFNLFPHLTALGNVMEGLLTVRRMPRAQAEALARTQLARVGLPEKAHDYPARLSGGQKQRVAIARALAMEPEILLFDEPTSALDPGLVGEVLRLIRSLADEGRTMLLVTHELGFAYHVANRVLFIAEGRIHEQGTPQQMLKHPQREATRAFLASFAEFDF